MTESASVATVTESVDSRNTPSLAELFVSSFAGLLAIAAAIALHKGVHVAWVVLIGAAFSIAMI